MSRFMTLNDAKDEEIAANEAQALTEWPIDIVMPTASRDDRRLGNLLHAITSYNESTSEDSDSVIESHDEANMSKDS
jgi:hypothetical protein